MINIKKLSIILLLSTSVVGFSYADNGNCDDVCATSTFYAPRDITTDLTYRNNLTSYHRQHDAACNFVSWDSAVIYQKSTSNKELGAGFLGNNPILVAETGTDVNVNALNLGLGLSNPNNFSEEYSICPSREVISWLPQIYFNLDCLYTGAWFEVSFAVSRAKHELNQTVGAQVSTLGEAKNVAEALDARDAYWADCDIHTGLDNVFFQLGYDWRYCANDHVGVYFAGVAPTGKDFNQAQYFAPQVGDKHGAIGFGLKGDYTIYECDADNTDFVFQSEFLYLYGFKHTQNRSFDLCENGPLSRYLLAVNNGLVDNPLTNLNEVLTGCVEVTPRHKIQWWANFHYQWCNWAAEFSYNLFWRDSEKIDCFAFAEGNDNYGIFSQGCPVRTTNSAACISTLFSDDLVQDLTALVTTADNVNLHSGAAQKVLTHKIGGAVAYNTVLCDCYAMYFGLGGGYELASCKDKRQVGENWHIYGKWDIAF